MFNKNKTKWMPLCAFENHGNSYIILARLNFKTGMIYFKQKRLNKATESCHHVINLNITEQFDKLCKLTVSEDIHPLEVR